MLVYGDRARTVAVAEEVARLDAGLRALAAAPPGIARHGRLAALFVDAAGLAQGLADHAHGAAGPDAGSAAEDAALALLLPLAGALLASWESGFAALPLAVDAPLAGLRRAALPERVSVKHAEGYAYYALYPEAYGLAARRALRGLGPVRVIGIRSIGTGLGALVAAAVGAPPPVTVRPVGHPFQRRIALSRELEQRLLGDRHAVFAIVDEGPGLSGSSFGAVADWLEERGVPRTRIHAFPSHPGDLGPQASPRHRERWARLPRHVLGLDDLALGDAAPPHRLDAWVADLAGPPSGPLREISGGGWRALRDPDEAAWPPAHVGQERRKFLLDTGNGPVLLKFAGLGRAGEGAFERARRLHEAGFCPKPLGLRHGFLVERWHGEGVSLDRAPVERGALLERVGAYLAFRAGAFPVDDEAGAPLAELHAMLRHNAGLALGAAAAAALDPLAERLAPLESRVRRVATDNRMHPVEWLRLPDGRLLKTDAVDHHAAHDLVGAQDIAWDVAGAAVEFGLEAPERAALCGRVARETGRPVDPALLAFLTGAYLAFQLGHHTLAADSLGGWPAEAERLRAAARRYGAGLAAWIAGEGSAPPAA